MHTYTCIVHLLFKNHIYVIHTHALNIGVIHGRGRYTYADGAYYEGSFDMGAKSGYGVHAFVSGARYQKYVCRHTFAYYILHRALTNTDMMGCGRTALPMGGVDTPTLTGKYTRVGSPADRWTMRQHNENMQTQTICPSLNLIISCIAALSLFYLVL